MRMISLKNTRTHGGTFLSTNNNDQKEGTLGVKKYVSYVWGR